MLQLAILPQDQELNSMANALEPLAMSGEQFQHLANLFLTSQAINLGQAEVESAKTFIDRCDGPVPERIR